MLNGEALDEFFVVSVPGNVFSGVERAKDDLGLCDIPHEHALAWQQDLFDYQF
jgi:hypothetical protein